MTVGCNTGVDKLIAKPHRWQLTAVAAAALIGLWGTPANALSLGRVNVQSALGEPLRAEIEILDINADEAATLKARVAPPDAFKTAGLDYNAAMTSLQASLQRRANGRAYIRLSSDRAINEPFVDMILEASWSTGRIVRDYTMLFDPPGSRSAARNDITPAQTPQPQPAPTPPRLVTPAAPAAAEIRPPRPPAATETRPPSPSTAVRPAPAAPPQARQSEAKKPQLRVRAGDTAGRIAAANKPANVSLDQMLVAMLRANPDAFIGNNVNRVKAGALVTLPTDIDATATSPAQASQIIVAQSQDFNAFRRKLASMAPTTQVATASRGVSGKLEASVEDKKPGAATPDKLTLSKGAVTGKAAEDKLAQARNAQETANRAAELEKNLQDLNKLASASAAGAASSAAKSAQPSLPAPLPPPELAAASADVPAVSAAAVAADATASAAAAASAAAPASAPASVAAPAKPASQAAPALPLPVQETGFVDGLLEDPLVPAGALGLIALLAGFGFYRARQRKKALLQDSSFGDSRLQAESFFGNSGGQNVDTHDNAATGSSMMYSPSQLEAVDDVDPVAEADVYLAYGRDLQAEEILKDALRTRPERLAIHQKLLEIYAKRRDAKAFEAIATLAFNLTDGMGQDWQQICEKGLALDPDNALYLPGGQPYAERGPNTRPAGLDTLLPDVTTDADKPSGEAALASTGTTDLDLDLDFSQDEPDLPQIETALPEVPAAAAGSQDLAQSNELAWDLPEPVVPVEPPEPQEPESARIPLDFSMPELDTAPGGDDFDKTQVIAIAPNVDKPTAAESGMMEFDLGSLSLDFDTSKPTPLTGPDANANANTSTSTNTSELNFDLDDDIDAQAGGFAQVGDNPLETKLALAEEFKAIGDDDGARALIEEVISEATGEIKAKAQQALKLL